MTQINSLPIGSVVIVIVFAFLITHFSLPSTISPLASAQRDPIQAFITWKALNFYPAYFEGKALPSLNSPVTLAVEAARNSVLLDLSQAEITWEVDGKFIAGGRGVKRATFTVRKGVGDTHFARVSILLNRETFETSLRIPVAASAVVIDAPYPEARGSGGGITLRALPFFFNAVSLSDLSFSWLIDGERASAGSDSELTISGNAARGTRAFRVTLEAQNLRNLQETAVTKGQFSIAP